MRKEEIAQYVIDNRYQGDEMTRMPDSEMYNSIIDEITALQNSELTSLRLENERLKLELEKSDLQRYIEKIGHDAYFQEEDSPYEKLAVIDISRLTESNLKYLKTSFEINPIPLEKPKNKLPISKVIFFKLKKGKYMTTNDIEITSEFICKYPHTIIDGEWGYLIIETIKPLY